MLKQILFSLFLFGGLVSAQFVSNESTCGVKGPHPSGELGIVGGDDAAPFEFPWQGELLSKILCGASILSDRWIITAAHCVLSEDASKYTFKAGSLRYRGPANDAQPRTDAKIEKVIPHPNYHIDVNNDIALLKLKEPLPLSDLDKHLAPICLPNERAPNGDLDYLAGTVCTATGWGDISPDGERSEILQRVNITIWKQSTCNDAYHGHIEKRAICAAAPGRDSCSGDSGGPLICYADGRWRLVGLVSWGGKCADPEHPGVYTRVTEFLPWIKETIANN